MKAETEMRTFVHYVFTLELAEGISDNTQPRKLKGATISLMVPYM
jgi:hypothetical protein